MIHLRASYYAQMWLHVGLIFLKWEGFDEVLKHLYNFVCPLANLRICCFFKDYIVQFDPPDDPKVSDF